LAVHLIHDVAPAPSNASSQRTILLVIGVLLVTCGSVCACAPLVYLPFFVQVAAGDDTRVPAGDTVLIVIAAIVAIAAVATGIRFIRGRRRLGLYLRKFGFAASTTTVTQALTSAVGRSIRLVTLDDDETRSVGAARGWLTTAAAVLAVVAPVLSIWFLRTELDSTFSQLETATQPTQRIHLSVPDIILTFVSGAVVLATPILAVLGSLFFGGSLAAYRAKRRASFRLTHEKEIDSAARRLVHGARRIFAARLVVVEVAGAFWQKAVDAFATVSEVVVIDVSHPTEPLVWEVGTMKPRFQGRWVLVGDHELVARLNQPTTDVWTHRLALLLNGETVLVYGPSPADRRRFAVALRHALASTTRPGPVQTSGGQ
jgi:hypothetical protein